MAGQATSDDQLTKGVDERLAKARVCVVYTGGTIGMVKDHTRPGAPLSPANAEALLAAVPSLADAVAEKQIYMKVIRISDDVDVEIPPLDSSDVMKDHWTAIARAIEDNYDDFDGFVVLHGTDTMAYTCSALSFLLRNLAKPVVVTGSQLPIVDPRTDGLLNFINAVYIAGYKATDLPLVPEVTLAFADALFRGNRLTKVSTERPQGFDTPNYPRLGDLGEHIKIYPDRVRPPADGNAAPFYADRSFGERGDVVVLGLYPGIRREIVDEVASIKGVKGLILRTFGAGNAPTEAGSPGLLDAIGAAVDRGIQVVNVTQCTQGKVEAGLYEASSGLLDRGVLSGLDMTEEAALTKLMWLFATEPDPGQIPIQMQLDRRGELSESLFDVRLKPPTSSEPAGDESKTLTLVGQLPTQYSNVKLKRATVRLSGVKILANDGSVSIRGFLNMPTATAMTSMKDPHLAFDVHTTNDGGVVLAAEVTETVRRVLGDSTSISFTLVCEQEADGTKLNPELIFDTAATRASVSLFTSA